MPQELLRRPPRALAFEADWPGWWETLVRPGRLIRLALGLGLLASPALVSSAGVLPTAGAVLVASSLGRVVSALVDIPGRGATVVLVGLAIAAGAAFTRWSALLNYAFLIFGLVTAATGTAVLLGAWSRDRHGR